MNQKTTEKKKTAVRPAATPKRHTLPPPADLSRCEGCPYPGVGFICWNMDGTCMRTDERKLSRRDERRQKK